VPGVSLRLCCCVDSNLALFFRVDYFLKIIGRFKAMTDLPCTRVKVAAFKQAEVA
jgi:hypothetical protein